MDNSEKKELMPRDTSDEIRVTDDELALAWQKTHPYIKLMSCYKCAMMEIETKFNVLNEHYSLLYDRQPISYIKTRLKSPISIRDKMLKKNIPMTVENIRDVLNDIAGIRVVCSFLDDVYMLEDAFLKQDDIKLIKRKDYIAEPKDNGYRSLHLIVEVPIFLQQEKLHMKAEIQFRTLAMDAWASLEHQLNYKKNDDGDMDFMQDSLVYCAQLCADFDRKMDDLRGDLHDKSTQPEFFRERTETELDEW